MKTLYDPVILGDMLLDSRLIMAPLTRNRAPQALPTDLMKEYYVQRADPDINVAMIISEATAISPEAQGYVDVPGIWNAEQTQAWKHIVDGVHQKGAKIVMQLWHVGRVSHTSLQPNAGNPLAPSAILAKTRTALYDNGVIKFIPTSMPRAIQLAEINPIIEQYRQATENAKKAGFDGVEIHAANGYLIQQFLSDASNVRTDEYGGSISNRIKFCLQVVDVVTKMFGDHKVGIRLSPTTKANDIADSQPKKLYSALLSELASYKLMYIHLIEGDTGGDRTHQYPNTEPVDYTELKDIYRQAGGNGAWMLNNGYTEELASQSVLERADLIAFGKPCIANPDLKLRFKLNAPLNPVNFKTLYGGGAQGYTDYPFLAKPL
ncbi:MAG: alkene reductase [Gammaproteobacteria bacterium]|nr:alkene reductase [Gammaproteobacteria bacterium]